MSVVPVFDVASAAALPRVVATELREIRARLEKLAEVLAGDPALASRYLLEFQDFDYVIQHADECAMLLERVADGEDARAAVCAIRLDAVQVRIRAALGEE
ncbi:hypothetical protein [uncultured Sphingomonas sp.]|uniref:hypothetical protein n=1 Tax=uncultured Sphingomonas sp. TaxID=158754 RepID=UPI00262C4DF9|nr:hypothetical protein [uncultured Sphingomonas sp.]